MAEPHRETKLHDQRGHPITSFRRERMSQTELRGMGIKEAWRLARKRFPYDKDAQTQEYRKLMRGGKDGD